MEYTDLKRYCDAKKITYREFGHLVDPSGEKQWKTYYKIITGRTKAGKITGRKLDAFISRNILEIKTVIGKRNGNK
jgi:hypothetical protein